LRVKYLENVIYEEDFKIMIQRNDKKNKKNTEIAQVLQLSNTAVTDIVYRFMDNLEKSDINVESFLSELEEINKYCNDIFKDISFTYSTVQYGFTDNFTFIRIVKEKKVKKKGYIDQDSDDDSIAFK